MASRKGGLDLREFLVVAVILLDDAGKQGLHSHGIILRVVVAAYQIQQFTVFFAAEPAIEFD